MDTGWNTKFALEFVTGCENPIGSADTLKRQSERKFEKCTVFVWYQNKRKQSSETYKKYNVEDTLSVLRNVLMSCFTLRCAEWINELL